MPGYRPERVAEMVHREVAERLMAQIKDPRLSPISITSVSVSRDLSRAAILYTPLGGGQPSSELVEGLESAAKRMRGPIGRALRLRHAPELVFTYDAQVDAAFRVMGVIDRLTAERNAREPKPEAEAESEQEE